MLIISKKLHLTHSVIFQFAIKYNKNFDTEKIECQREERYHVSAWCRKNNIMLAAVLSRWTRVCQGCTYWQCASMTITSSKMCKLIFKKVCYFGQVVTLTTSGSIVVSHLTLWLFMVGSIFCNFLTIFHCSLCYILSYFCLSKFFSQIYINYSFLKNIIYNYYDAREIIKIRITLVK